MKFIKVGPFFVNADAVKQVITRENGTLSLWYGDWDQDGDMRLEDWGRGEMTNILRAYFEANSVNVPSVPKQPNEADKRKYNLASNIIAKLGDAADGIDNQYPSGDVKEYIMQAIEDTHKLHGLLAQPFPKISVEQAMAVTTGTPKQTELVAVGYRDTLSTTVMRLQEIQADTVGNISQNAAEWIEESINDLQRILRANETPKQTKGTVHPIAVMKSARTSLNGVEFYLSEGEIESAKGSLRVAMDKLDSLFTTLEIDEILQNE